MGDAHQEASRNTETSERQTVTVRGSAAGFAQEIVTGPHRLTSEPVTSEPVYEGGRATGLRLAIRYLRPWGLYFIDGWGVQPSQTMAARNGWRHPTSLRSTLPIASAATPRRICLIGLNEIFFWDLSPPNSVPSCWKLRITAPFIEH
jgi:hypothetical protein